VVGGRERSAPMHHRRRGVDAPPVLAEATIELG
jgi:hypothetical protein